MERSGKQNAGTLVYQKHQLNPQDLLIFSEMAGFVDDWQTLGLNVEFDLLALQVAIMAHPKQGSVIPRCSGLRKMQFAPPKGIGGKRKGKRASCRVCYVYFEEFHTVLLVAAYAKGRKEDITEDDRRVIRKAIDRAQESLSNRYSTASVGKTAKRG